MPHTEKRYKKGEIICRPKEMVMSMYNILYGSVGIYFDYGTPEQVELGQVSADEMAQYRAEGHFAEGSMLPKVQAALRFVRSRPGRRAIITALDRAEDALAGRTGTVIQ